MTWVLQQPVDDSPELVASDLKAFLMSPSHKRTEGLLTAFDHTSVVR